jgi:MFS family permease
METQIGDKKDILYSRYYGWKIVFVATLALAVSNGLTTLGIAVFSKPIREDFVNLGAVPHNESESMIAAASYLTFLTAGFISPLTGFLVKRFSLKLMMVTGCFMLGGALLLHSQAANPGMVYISRILMGISLGFVGVMPNVVLISRWFKRLRGTAMGIVLTGTSLGGFAIPLIATPLVLTYGWRNAMLAVSLLVWLILLPAILLLVRNTPEEIGLLPDNNSAVPAVPEAPEIGETGEIAEINEPGTAGLPGMTLRRALTTPVFWVFALCAAAVFYSIFLTTQQFVLYLQTERIGVTALTAGYLLSTLFAASIGGKFFFGWLSDRFPPPRVMLVCCSVMFLATFILFDLNAQNAIFFILLFGLGYGGTFVLLQLLVLEFFGQREYGKILGIIVMIEMIGAAIGGKITGYLADANGGDYTRAFYGMIISTTFALFLTLILNGKKYLLGALPLKSGSNFL